MSHLGVGVGESAGGELLPGGWGKRLPCGGESGEGALWVGVFGWDQESLEGSAGGGSGLPEGPCVCVPLPAPPGPTVLALVLGARPLSGRQM